MNVGKMKNPRSSVSLKIWQYRVAEVEIPQVPNEIPQVPNLPELDSNPPDPMVLANLIDSVVDGRRKLGGQGWFC